MIMMMTTTTTTTVRLLVLLVVVMATATAWVTPMRPPTRGAVVQTPVQMSEEPKIVDPPTTFREAEVLGLRMAQDGDYEGALRAFQSALKLPGSYTARYREVKPSKVGGQPVVETYEVQELDIFEKQSAHYNMACACAQLGRLDESLSHLRDCFAIGFRNYKIAKTDPDFDPIREEPEFKKLMKDTEKEMGFIGKFIW
mmetsp:Transcript_27863/g.64554  ORF Transcript_27863/g.64554 Transcript_27863/m.64554 type:complete len:198 (+) Transcript_27863:2-595(+)